MKKVLLYSGGMDSYIIDKLWKPDVKLYIDYGTKQTAEERKRLPDDVIVKEIDLSQYMESDGKSTIPLRNLIFAAIAVNYGDVIAIGGVKDDLHYDKTKRFARKTTRLFNSVLKKEDSKRKVRVSVPYRNYKKSELMYLYVKHGGSIEDLKKNTWSCYTPVNDKECGECTPCKRKAKAIQHAKELQNLDRYNKQSGYYIY